MRVCKCMYRHNTHPWLVQPRRQCLHAPKIYYGHKNRPWQRSCGCHAATLPREPTTRQARPAAAPLTTMRRKDRTSALGGPWSLRYEKSSSLSDVSFVAPEMTKLRLISIGLRGQSVSTPSAMSAASTIRPMLPPSSASRSCPAVATDATSSPDGRNSTAHTRASASASARASRTAARASITAPGCTPAQRLYSLRLRPDGGACVYSMMQYIVCFSPRRGRY